jgi:hypothetical protein
MKLKLKLLHIKCHVLGFTKDKAQKIVSKDNSEFLWKLFISQFKHTLFALEERGLPQMTYTCESL